MVHNVVKNKRFLQSPKRASATSRRALLDKASDSEIKTVQEVALNVVKSRIPLPKRTIIKLKPHKAVIKQLAAKKGSIKSKRKLLVQKGGFLPVLLTTALAYLANELTN